MIENHQRVLFVGQNFGWCPILSSSDQVSTLFLSYPSTLLALLSFAYQKIYPACSAQTRLRKMNYLAARARYPVMPERFYRASTNPKDPDLRRDRFPLRTCGMASPVFYFFFFLHRISTSPNGSIDPNGRGQVVGLRTSCAKYTL